MMCRCGAVAADSERNIYYCISVAITEKKIVAVIMLIVKYN